MGGTRIGRMMRGLVAVVAIVAATAMPVGAASTGSLVVTPTGASGSTVYVTVTNLGAQPASTTIKLVLTSGSTTLVGSSNVTVSPMSTVVVPVPMSGTLSLAMKLNLSSTLQLGATTDTDCPF